MKTTLSKNQIKELLENYSIGEIVSFRKVKTAYQNEVVIVKTKKKKFVLKVFENRNKEYVVFQTKIRNYLKENKVPVAKIIKTKNKEDFCYFENKLVQLEEFVQGGKAKLNVDLVKEVGKVMGEMDLLLKKSNFKATYEYTQEFFKPLKTNNKKVKTESKKLVKEMKKINENKLTKSIIHTDIHLGNLLVKNNKIKAIIDFNDLAKEYTLVEPMVFIADELITKKIHYNKIKLFLEEYQKYIKLNEEELKAIPYFLQYRCLSAIDWIEGMIKKHPTKNKQLKKSLNHYWDKYYLINNSKNHFTISNNSLKLSI